MAKAKRTYSHLYEMVHQQDENGVSATSQDPYGWAKYRPTWLQWINRPAWFLFFTCMAATAQSMCVNGLIGVTISTLEKRFDFSSTSASMISSFYEFSSIPIILVVGYIGATCNRPRLIGIGMLMTSLGSLLYALPHFTTDKYEFRDAAFDNLCHLGENNTNVCDSTADSSEENLHYLYLFIFTTLLFAIGAQPLFILAVTYLDDSLSRHDSAIYLGIFYCTGSIGPAIAYIGGGYLLDVYTDMNTAEGSIVEITSDDPRWVGAWWIGFLFTSLLALITVVPLIGFPKKMDYDDNKESKNLETYFSGGADPDQNLSTQPGFGRSLKDIPSVFKVLFKNPTFMLTTGAAVFDAMLINGFTNFGPKYLENQFSIHASTAGMIFGIIVVPGAAGGSIVGSLLVKKLKMDCTQCLRGMFIASVAVTSLLGIFLIRCDNAKFYGVNTGNSSELLSPSCLGSCDCSRHSYSPVCGGDNLTYFSPCYAGCQTTLGSEQKTYSNCSCLPDVPSIATEGICPVHSCVLLPLYIVMMLLAMLCMFIEAMFHVQVILRCVPQSQRSFALSIDSILGRLLGSIPGAVLFGAILDKSCVLWEEKCHGNGTCLYYNNSTMALYMLLLCGTAKATSTLFAFLAWRFYKSKGSAGIAASDVTLEDTISDAEDL